MCASHAEEFPIPWSKSLLESLLHGCPLPVRDLVELHSPHYVNPRILAYDMLQAGAILRGLDAERVVCAEEPPEEKSPSRIPLA